MKNYYVIPKTRKKNAYVNLHIKTKHLTFLLSGYLFAYRPLHESYDMHVNVGFLLIGTEISSSFV